MPNDAGLEYLLNAALKKKSRKEALAWLDTIGRDYHGLMSRVIAKFSFKRTLDQNALYYLWVGQVAEHQGETKEDVHREAKLSIGCPILFRDNEKFATFYRRVMAPLPRDMRLEAISWVDVSSVMTTKQFGEFADQFEKTWRARGVDLVIPEEK